MGLNLMQTSGGSGGGQGDDGSLRNKRVPEEIFSLKFFSNQLEHHLKLCLLQSLFLLELLEDEKDVLVFYVVSSGWSFVSAILGQMTYSIASPTLDSAGSYVMQGAPFTQGMIPSIPIGGSISPEGFLPSILLLVFNLFATGISLGPVFLLGFVGICHGSSLCFQSGGTKKYRGSNSSNGGNTGDGVKIAGGVIGSGGEIGENTGGIILSLEFSEELKELLPDEAGK
ncbi:hypothetical protein Tco_1361889 [Tanacetum coccineum]